MQGIHLVPINSYPKMNQKFLVCIGIHASTDQFILDISHVGKDANLEPKKRDIVSLTSRICDPMGILSPLLTIQFKELFQKICMSKLAGMTMS